MYNQKSSNLRMYEFAKVHQFSSISVVILSSHQNQGLHVRVRVQGHSHRYNLQLGGHRQPKRKHENNRYHTIVDLNKTGGSRRMHANSIASSKRNQFVLVAKSEYCFFDDILSNYSETLVIIVSRLLKMHYFKMRLRAKGTLNSDSVRSNQIQNKTARRPLLCSHQGLVGF